MLSSLQ